MKLIKEIFSKSGELHFQRWSVLSTSICNIYIHHILKADEDLHLHDHPWSFVNIILKGGYVDLNKTSGLRERLPFSIGFMAAKGQYHKILRIIEPTWSLVITGPRNHDWGYDTENGFVQHSKYRELKNNEQWLWKNPEALAMVKRGLADAAAGRFGPPLEISDLDVYNDEEVYTGVCDKGDRHNLVQFYYRYMYRCTKCNKTYIDDAEIDGGLKHCGEVLDDFI